MGYNKILVSAININKKDSVKRKAWVAKDGKAILKKI